MSKTAIALAVVIMFVAGGAAGAYVLVTQNHDKAENHDSDGHEHAQVIECEGLSVHFLELGNKYTGDCVYINYGDVDILIDAGSNNSSATTIINYIDDYVNSDTNNGKIEYVIATHAHQDHIAGFYSAGKITGVLDAFEIGTVIDYSRTDSNTATRTNYEKTVKKLVDTKGTQHYTALQCYRETDGAQRVYDIGENATLEILYQPYYEAKASTENNYSVCVMITYDGRQYLFTGDLEKAGEDALVDYYASYHGGLGKCVLLKGGHHGSSTSCNQKLLQAVDPDYIIICTCAGSTEYTSTASNTFPMQQLINRIALYTNTDKVYVTTVSINYDNGIYRSLNGNVVFWINEGVPTVTCSGDSRVLKDTDWFKANRTTPPQWA